MSPDKLPSAWLTLPIFFGLFFGGGYLGMQVSRAVAPGSGLAELVSFLALPAAFVIGIVAWAGAALPGAARRFLRLLRKKQGLASAGDDGLKATIPPGTFAFVPAALFTCLPAGAIVGAVSASFGFGWVLFLYAALGLAYGAACWRLARTGYLPFPRE